MGLAEGLLEEEELELGGQHRAVAHRLEAADLAAEDGAGAVRDLGVAVVVENVA